MCTAESHHDFNQVERRQHVPDSPGPRLRLSPQKQQQQQGGKLFRKRFRPPGQYAPTSTSQGGTPRASQGGTPRARTTHAHSKSVSPRVDNPYEEEFLQELLQRREKKPSTLFPNIAQPRPKPSPPKTQKMLITPVGGRRTVSAPNVENKSLRVGADR